MHSWPASALHNLARLGLVTIDPGSAERTVRVHPLVQATVRGMLPAAVLRQAAQAAAEATVPDLARQDAQPMLSQALRDNTASLHRCTGDLLLAPESPPVLFRAGRSLDSSGLTEQAVGYWQQMIDAIDRVLGPGHPEALTARDQIAAAYDKAGLQDEAISAHRQCLGERERQLGPGHPDTLACCGDLARAYLTAGAAEAVPLYERTLAGLEWFLGADHPDTLTARGNLALAYSSAGRLDDAIGSFQRTVADRDRVLGPDHPDTLDVAGQPRRRLSRRRAAERGHPAVPEHPRRPRAGTRRRPPGHHDLTGRPRLRVPVSGEAEGRDTAVQAHPRRPRAGTRRRPPGHADLAGQPRRRLPHRPGGPKKPSRCTSAPSPTADRLQGPDHPDTVTARGNLAAAYHSAGRIVDAIPLYERTVADCERVRGPYHEDTLISRCNLATPTTPPGGRLTPSPSSSKPWPTANGSSSRVTR